MSELTETDDERFERRKKAGAGLLGLSEQPITYGDRAYFKVLGVDDAALDKIIEEISSGETAVMRFAPLRR